MASEKNFQLFSPEAVTFRARFPNSFMAEVFSAAVRLSLLP